MLYLVEGEFVEPGALMSPQQFASVVEKMIIPSLEQLAEQTHSGKIVGGIKAGSRTSVFIVQAENNKEIDEYLFSLPFWALIKWTVIPLQSLDDRIPLARNIVQQLKNM